MTSKDHILVREPEYLSTTELIFSYGFLKIASIIFTPLTFVIIIMVLFKKFKK